MAYGGLFTGTPEEVFNNVVLYLQQLASLQGLQIEDPALVAQVIQAALFVIQDDFAPEVFQTISFAAERLAKKQIAY